MDGSPRWMTTEEVAQEAGTGTEWVRRQIAAGRLRATVWTAGGRRMYRIRPEDWRQFRARFSRTTDDPDW